MKRGPSSHNNLPLRTAYASGRWKENVYYAECRLTGML